MFSSEQWIHKYFSFFLICNGQHGRKESKADQGCLGYRGETGQRY